MSKKIMIVDDSALIRMQVKRALAGDGFDVVEAVDGRDAIEKLSEQLLMVVCDVNMPRMNGLEFLECLRAEANYKDLPVIMLTTEGQPELMRAARALGSKGWLLKPFKPHLLKAAVSKITAEG